MCKCRVRAQKKRNVVGMCNEGASVIGSAEGRDAGAEISSGAPQTYCDDSHLGILLKCRFLF